MGHPGFSITTTEYGVALAAFLITAIATGRLATQLKLGRIQAVERKNEMERLYKVVNALLDTGSDESTIAQLSKNRQPTGALLWPPAGCRGADFRWETVGNHNQTLS